MGDSQGPPNIGRSNPVARYPLSRQITDRAKRYRARKKLAPGVNRCFACGRPGRQDTHHLGGNEANNQTRNLIRACRPCHVRISNVMRKAGIGKLTRQYNPQSAAEGARNLGQWMNAVMTVKGDPGGDMDLRDAIAMIRATSERKRAEFSSEAWGTRYAKYGRKGHNPVSVIIPTKWSKVQAKQLPDGRILLRGVA